MSSSVMTPERFWEARPRRALEWRETAGGQCVLLRPKFGRGRIGRWFASRLADPHYRIRLDDIGTFVWKACDGQTPLLTIADGMRTRFGPDIEPAERRLALFVRKMLRSKIIALEETEDVTRP
jgi:hypothetical protein